jgi:hypothetical protein
VLIRAAQKICHRLSAVFEQLFLPIGDFNCSEAWGLLKNPGGLQMAGMECR